VKSLFGETGVRIIALGALLLTLVLAFFVIQILLVPFVAALFVVYLFDPAILAMQRRGIDRGHAFILLLFLTVAVVAVVLMFMPSWLRLESLGVSSDTFSQRVTEQVSAIERWLNANFPMVRSANIGEQISTKVAELASRFFGELPGLITAFIVNLLLVPFIAYFMIRDGKTLKRKLVELVPNRYFEMTLMMFSRIDQQIGGYLRGRLIECILVGITQALLMGVVSILVPQRQILLIAAVCGITNMIPYLGPVLGTIFGSLLYLGGGLPITSIYGLVAAAAGAHIVDNIVIAPAVLSHNVDLHPLTVALVLVIGGELLGTLGLLIAIPVASSIKVIAQEVYANYQLRLRV
jgi:predicted PurR-regulated permease PerM